MSDVVIQVDSLSKRYRLGMVGTRTLTHDFERWWARVRGRPDPYLKIGQEEPRKRLTTDYTDHTDKNSAPNPCKSVSSVVKTVPDIDDPDHIWALRDVSFEVKQGEVLGIIGRNGAGKSTLLKILSRVTAPTLGEVRVKGRIASLLEVGTGFHPELTGRENIFLNGAILGMTKAEIRKKFDEIVAFSEVEKFIDTPVKRYSSGMYVRLAFAVAAHLDPEILIVDEVLAVGDAAFQKKCLGKMGDVARGGRTVLFVSHNMGAVLQLCSRALYICDGACTLDGPVDRVVSNYLSGARVGTRKATFPQDDAKDAQITCVQVVSSSDEVLASHPYTQPFYALLDYTVRKWPIGSYVCLDVFNEADVRVLWGCDVRSVDDMTKGRLPGNYRARVRLPGSFFAPGCYSITAAIFAPGRGACDVREKAVSVEITDSGSLLSNFGIRPHAATMVVPDWETTLIST